MNTRRKRSHIVSWSVLIASALVAAMPSPAAAAEAVNIYTARHYDTDGDLYAEFTEKTGIEVNVVKGGSDFLVERIKTEGRNTYADVLITVDAGRLWRAEQAGVLQATRSDFLEERIPASLRHPDGLWFGFTKRARVIVYAKDRVEPEELSTYEDLADEKWKDRLCVRSSNNIYNQSLMASLIAAHGEEKALVWAEGIVANLSTPPHGTDTGLVEAVAAGSCDVTFVNHYYVVRMLEDDPSLGDKVGVFFPNQEGRGTHVNVSGAGRVAHAPHPENAVKFLEFLATPEAQEVFAGGNHEFPAVEGVEVGPIIESWGGFKSDSVNVSLLGQNNPIAVRIMDRAGWR